MSYTTSREVARAVAIGIVVLIAAAAILGLSTALLSGAYLARVDASAKPSIASCVTPGHVEATR